MVGGRVEDMKEGGGGPSSFPGPRGESCLRKTDHRTSWRAGLPDARGPPGPLVGGPLVGGVLWVGSTLLRPGGGGHILPPAPVCRMSSPESGAPALPEERQWRDANESGSPGQRRKTIHVDLPGPPQGRWRKTCGVPRLRGHETREGRAGTRRRLRADHDSGPARWASGAGGLHVLPGGL